jgi:ribosomal protein L23
MSALSYKVKDNNVLILEDFSFETPKTKQYIDILQKFNMLIKSHCWLFPKPIKTLSFLQGIFPKQVAVASDINTYQILNAQHIFLLKARLKEVENILLINQCRWVGKRSTLKKKKMNVLIKPLITEKMTAVTEKFPNRYGFVVDERASKNQIKAAVEANYGVTVESVNTMNYVGKRKVTFYQNRIDVR